MSGNLREIEMLNFITEEHKMISASFGTLFKELCRSDSDSALKKSGRISADIIGRSLRDIGLFEDLGPEAPTASSLLQVLVVLEAGKACLPFPVLETLSAVFVFAHIKQRDYLDLSKELVTQPSLQGELDDLPVLCDGRLSGTVNALPFAELCGKAVVSVRCPTQNDPTGMALLLVNTAAGESRRRNSVEPDYPTQDLLIKDAVILESLVFRELAGERQTAGLHNLHNSLLAAAEIAGAGLRLIEMTRDYLLTRTQFGKPLGANQVLKHRIARHFVRTQALVTMVCYAAAAMDAGAEDARAAVHSAKHFAGKAGKALAQDMLQMHGAIGYTTEYPLHLYMRRIFRLTASYGSTYAHGELLFQEFDRMAKAW